MNDKKLILLKFNQLLSYYNENEFSNIKIYTDLICDEMSSFKESKSHELEIEDKEFFEVLLNFSNQHPNLLINTISPVKNSKNLSSKTIWFNKIHNSILKEADLFSKSDEAYIFILYDIKSIESLELTSYTDAFFHSGILFSKLKSIGVDVSFYKVKHRNSIIRKLNLNINEVMLVSSFKIKGV